MKKLSIIIPAYNEEETISFVLAGVKRVIKRIKVPCEIIVVNDGSIDKTRELLEKEKGVLIVNHPYKKGYGASLKHGINKAEGDFVLFIDADGQQDPDDIPELAKYAGEYDMAVGARTNSNSFSRAMIKKALALFANYLAGFKIPDLNSGFRIINKEIAKKYFFILPNAFSFSSTITLALIKDGYSIKYMNVKELKRAGGKSSIHPIKDTIRFFMIIVRLSSLFNPLKIFLPITAMIFIAGIWSFIYDIIHLDITDTTILLLLTSILLFFFGLMADQMAAIRRQIK